MEEEGQIPGEDVPLPPPRLFERLSSIHGYIWDQYVSMPLIIILQA